MKVVWTRQADVMLGAAIDAMLAERPTAAQRWLERLMDRVRLLERFPDSGRIVPESARPEVREVLVAPYRVPYHRDEYTVTILGVVHSRRALEFEDGPEWPVVCQEARRSELEWAERGVGRKEAGTWADPG